VTIRGIGGARPFECVDRAGAIAEPLARLAEREPGGGEVGRALDRLREQIGGGREIAARLQVLGMPIAPVGDQVAGGEEERR
jgi:hypothetical protein